MLGEISSRENGTYQNGSMFLIKEIIVGPTTPAATSISFVSIPQNFNHLLINIYSRTSDATSYVNLGIRFNNDSGSNYYYQYSQAVGASTSYSSANNTYGYLYSTLAASAASGLFSVGECLIPQYATPNGNLRIYKSEGGGSGTSGTIQTYIMGSWTGTSPISTVTLVDANGGNINAGCYFYLYGIY